MRVVLLLLAGVAAVAALVLASRRNRLRPVVVTFILLLAVAWAFALAAVRADYEDADGFVDCWPHCSLVQDATGVALFGAPALGVLVMLTVVVLVLRGRRRG